MATFDVEKYVPTINVHSPPYKGNTLELALTFGKKSILRLSDLSTISAKKIRHALAQSFPNDEIAQNKVGRIYSARIANSQSLLDKRILECFGVIRSEREGESSDEDNAPPRPTQDL